MQNVLVSSVFPAENQRFEERGVCSGSLTPRGTRAEDREGRLDQLGDARLEERAWGWNTKIVLPPSFPLCYSITFLQF